MSESDFFQQLTGLPDAALGALLKLRPDLVVPVPVDSIALAMRAQAKVSVARALDGLDRFTLEILDGLRLCPEPSLAAVTALACTPTNGVTPELVKAAVGRLRARFIAYGTEDELELTPVIEELTSPYPSGLGRHAALLGEEVGKLVNDAAKVRRTLLKAPPAARALLDRLAEGPPVGTTTKGSEALTWLVEHHLLAEVSEGAVELPRELGLLLRRETGPLGKLHPEPPQWTEPGKSQPALDSAGAGQAMSAVRHAEDLLEALAEDPAAVLRGGGMGVLSLRRLAKAAGLSEPDAAVLLETAYAAGLIGELETSTDSVFIPAAGYDLWRGLPLAQRWARLARAWLAMPRQPGLVGRRDDRDRPITVLSPQLERIAVPGMRRITLTVLGGQAGTTPTPDQVIERLSWQTPRKLRGRESAYREIFTEAALLGLTGGGGLTGYTRKLLEETDPRLEHEDPLGLRPGADLGPDESPALQELGALLPPPVNHFLVQADLTVIVPGPPEPALAAELDLVADHESGGGASVFRVSQLSVRRALDTGYTAADLHGLFQRRSSTPVPQALTYLIDDVARTHGGLRTGACGAYLRSDDEGLISEVLADRRLAELQLRRIAPTVLTTPFVSGRLLTSLRDAGYAPVPEDAQGTAVLTRPRVKRASARPPVESISDGLDGASLTPARVMGIVEEIRAGDARTRANRRAPAQVRAAAGLPMSSLTAVQAHSQALAVLQQALRDRVKVWVGYVDAHGAAVSRLVRPVSLGAGYLRAEDERTQTLHTLALHRITAAAPAD